MLRTRFAAMTLSAAALALLTPGARPQGYFVSPNNYLVNQNGYYSGYGNSGYGNSGYGNAGYGSGVVVQPLWNGYGYGYYDPLVVGPNGVRPLYNSSAPYPYGYPNQANGEDRSDPNANVLPRTNDIIEARKETNSRLYLSWQGESRAVSRITFSLLDRARRPIKQETITAPPAHTRFAYTSRSAYYQVVVEYVNGTTNTVIAPL